MMKVMEEINEIESRRTLNTKIFKARNWSFKWTISTHKTGAKMTKGGRDRDK